MKKKLVILFLIGGFITTSCKKIVELEPQNSVTPTTALADVNGYQSLLVSVYDRMQSYTYWGRDMALMGDALADNIFTVTSQDTRYQGQNINTRGSHYNIWNNAYGAINELNTIIAGIDALTGVPASQLTLQKQVKAEAYALRGMIYFDLARVYGYEPNKVPTTGTGAGFTKSVILRLTPTTSAEGAAIKKRSSIVETYTSIESDLKTAIAGFAAIGAVKPANPYRITESATHALLGKVYLYWEKWASAVTEFDNALNASIVYAKLTPAGSYVSSFKAVPNPESLFEINYVQSVEVAGVTGSNDAPFTYTQPKGFNAANVNTFGSQTPSAELLALFEPADDRKGMFFTARTSTTTTVYNWVNKYSGANGAFTDNIKVIRYSDVLLMKAEALANQGQYIAASDLVKTLRAARTATTATVPVDAAIIPYIQVERQRELFFEGHRWFDLKRLGNGISKPAATAVGTIASTDYRILANPPSSEVLLNSDLNNPNY